MHFFLSANRVWLTVVLVLLVAACTSSRPKPEIVERFSTHISDNGSKQFAFSVESVRAESEAFNNSGGRSGKRGEGRRGSHPGGDERPSYDKMIKSIMKQLDKKLQATGYCQTGFIIIDRNIQQGAASVRGECDDTATPADRKKFSNDPSSQFLRR